MRHLIRAVTLACAAFVWAFSAAAQPFVAVNPQAISFYKYDVDTQPVSFTDFTTYNLGNQPLHFTGEGMYVTGPDADELEVVILTPFFPLQQQQSRVDRIYFRPTSRGLKQAVLNIQTNDPDDPVTTIPLTGVAAYSELSLSHNPFGVHSVNDGPTSRVITFTSTGALPLEFTSPGIDLDGHSYYTISDMPSTATMESGTSRSLVVTYHPLSDGHHTAKLRFHTNDTRSPLREIHLGASATMPELVTSSNDLQFGQKVITDTAATVFTLEYRNLGTELLQFTGSGFSITGPAAASFMMLDTPSTAALPVEQLPRKIRIGFKPTTVGSKFALLRITTNDPLQPVKDIALVGNAVPPRTATFVGQYNGYGPGQSIIGSGGHYSSLYDACEAASNTPLSGGNWTFLIRNDLVESKNSMLAQENTSGHSFIFRPEPGTSSTITFANQAMNPLEFPGHWVVGARYLPGTPSGSWDYRPTQNVIIDGSNTTKAPNRNLTLRSVERIGGTTSLIHVAGDSDNTIIQNCHFYHTNGFYSSVNGAMGAVEFIGERTPTSQPSGRYFNSPDNCTVRNCQFLVNGFHEAPAITLNFRFQSFSNAPVIPSTRGFLVEDNDILTTYTGIYVRDCDSVEVRNNRIFLERADPARDQRGIVFNPASEAESSATCVIDANLIQFDGTEPVGRNQAGISLSSRSTTSTIVISNNMISGLTSPPPVVNFTPSHVAIVNACDRNTTVVIAHNSINFHMLDGTTTSLGRCVAFEHAFVNQFFAGYSSIRNNIVRMEAEGGVIYQRRQGPGVLESDNNILYTLPSGYVGVLSANPPTLYTSLVDWQQGTGNDLNSLFVDPMIAVGMGNPATWIGPYGSPNPDMHFTHFPGSGYRRPPIPGIATDFDGETRYAVETMIGADEVDESTSVDAWELY